MDKAWKILSAGSGNSSPALGFPFNESAGVLLSRGKPYNDFPAGILFDNANKDQRDMFSYYKLQRKDPVLICS